MKKLNDSYAAKVPDGCRALTGRSVWPQSPVGQKTGEAVV